MSATQVKPDDTAFAGVGIPWSGQVVLPSHFSNPDGSEGAAIDWSGSSIIVSSKQARIAHTWDPATRTVTMSLTAEQLDRLGSSFRWYLAELGQFNDGLYWRIVEVSRPQ